VVKPGFIFAVHILREVKIAAIKRISMQCRAILWAGDSGHALAAMVTCNTDDERPPEIFGFSPVENFVRRFGIKPNGSGHGYPRNTLQQIRYAIPRSFHDGFRPVDHG
jgi:hypothetical protein